VPEHVMMMSPAGSAMPSCRKTGWFAAKAVQETCALATDASENTAESKVANSLDLLCGTKQLYSEYKNN